MSETATPSDPTLSTGSPPDASGGSAAAADASGGSSAPAPGGATPGAAPGGAPDYRGGPLDADRGPGLGCFWFQVAILGVLLVATPLSVVLAVDPWISGVLLVTTLILLLFVGQTTIFLLRLVAADRRSRRRPMSGSARRTVGQLEDEIPDTRSDEDDPGAR
jgi:hypothetical protein